MLEYELEDVLRERDDAEDFINELLDEVLGADRPEWSSAYNRYDAMNDVRERITALHKPAVDKAWGLFESVTAEPKPSPAAQVDAARYRWLTADHHKQEDRIRVYEIATSMNVRGKGHIDAAIDAARAAQEKKA